MHKILKDGHIHSPYCPHGTKDSFEKYIEKALEEGLEEISFTEHLPLPKKITEVLEQIKKENGGNENEKK